MIRCQSRELYVEKEKKLTDQKMCLLSIISSGA